MPPLPDWLVPEPFLDTDLGVLRSGKEAQINLIERASGDQRCVMARKFYVPRSVKQKGMLEALGVQRASSFHNDVQYREGRQFRKSRDRRAVEQMTTYGKHLLQDRWSGHECHVMTKLWDAGARVPYPVSSDGEFFFMEYIGDELAGAAPTLARARPRGPVLVDIFDQLVENLRIVVQCGYAHGDLSAYNLLWWHGEVFLIDFPQAVDLAENPGGLDFLHRDLVNVCEWFGRQGLERDPEEWFADLLCEVY